MRALGALGLLLMSFAGICGCFASADSDAIFLDGFDPCRKQFFYEQMLSDVEIENTDKHVLLQKSFYLNAQSKVLAIADGRIYSNDEPSAFLRIEIDEEEQHSSVAIHDWNTGSLGFAGQHSFNVMAYKTLAPGLHKVTLIGSAHPSNPGTFFVGDATGISIMIDPELQVLVDTLDGESQEINIQTYAPPTIDVNEGDPDRPYVGLLHNTISNPNNSILNALTLVSGRSFQSCFENGGEGDALWGFWTDNQCQFTDQASWGVNDIYTHAERQTSMYAQAFHTLLPQQSTTIEFGASELAFGTDQATAPSGSHENDVCYTVGNTKLITVLNDHMAASVGGNNTFCSTYTWKCVASTTGFGNCPAENSDVTLSSTQIDVPKGHSGVFFFSAKTRIQAGEPEDTDMVVVFGIKINGQQVGSLGVQELIAPDTGSSRSLTASYLSAVSDHSTPLPPGQHTVEAFIRVQADSVSHASVPEELTLFYFDFD